MNENAKTCFNYLRCRELGKAGYTKEKMEKNKPYYWGVIVLHTDSGLSAQDVYSKYKNRWKTETFYDFIKNGASFSCLKLEGYYEEEFAFILLITGLIHQCMKEALKKLGSPPSPPTTHSLRPSG